MLEAIVFCCWQSETNQPKCFSCMITTIHSPDLRHCYMAFIYHHHKIFRKIIQDAKWTLTWLTPVKISRIIFYTRTMSQLPESSPCHNSPVHSNAWLLPFYPRTPILPLFSINHHQFQSRLSAHHLYLQQNKLAAYIFMPSKFSIWTPDIGSIDSIPSISSPKCNPDNKNPNQTNKYRQCLLLL